MTRAAAKAVNLEERVFVGVSRRKCYLVVPYRKNTARVVPVAETRQRDAFGGGLS
jgi:hypothetical protein